MTLFDSLALLLGRLLLGSMIAVALFALFFLVSDWVASIPARISFYRRKSHGNDSQSDHQSH